jgi:hypothetical protein
MARGSEQQDPYSARFDLASLGFPQSFINSVQAQNFPTISVTGFESLGGVGWKNQPGYNYSLQSNLATVRERKTRGQPTRQFLQLCKDIATTQGSNTQEP